MISSHLSESKIICQLFRHNFAVESFHSIPIEWLRCYIRSLACSVCLFRRLLFSFFFHRNTLHNLFSKTKIFTINYTFCWVAALRFVQYMRRYDASHIEGKLVELKKRVYFVILVNDIFFFRVLCVHRVIIVLHQNTFEYVVCDFFVNDLKLKMTSLAFDIEIGSMFTLRCIIVEFPMFFYSLLFEAMKQ